MKKAYQNAEAYKVSFNAKEQVAAACDITADASMYPIGGGAVMACKEIGGKYGAFEDLGMCWVNGDGHMEDVGGSGAYDFTVQYA